jgi:hypothetical protein
LHYLQFAKNNPRQFWDTHARKTFCADPGLNCEIRVALQSKCQSSILSSFSALATTKTDLLRSAANQQSAKKEKRELNARAAAKEDQLAKNKAQTRHFQDIKC